MPIDPCNLAGESSPRRNAPAVRGARGTQRVAGGRGRIPGLLVGVLWGVLAIGPATADGPLCRAPGPTVTPAGPQCSVHPVPSASGADPAGHARLRAAVDPASGELTVPPVARRSPGHVPGLTAEAFGASLGDLARGELKPRRLADGTQVLGLRGRLRHPLHGTVVETPQGERTVHTGHRREAHRDP